MEWIISVVSFSLSLLFLIVLIIYCCVYAKTKPRQNAHPRVNSFQPRTASLDNRPSQISQTTNLEMNAPVVRLSLQSVYPPGFLPVQQGGNYYANAPIGNVVNTSSPGTFTAAYDHSRKKYPTHHRHSYTSPPYPTSPSHPLPQSPPPYPTFPLHPLPHTSMCSQNLYNPMFSFSSPHSSTPYPSAPVHHEFNPRNSEGGSNGVSTAGSLQAHRHSFAHTRPPSYEEATSGSVSIEHKRARLQKNNSLYDNN